jgi:hypothetical protein
MGQPPQAAGELGTGTSGGRRSLRANGGPEKTVSGLRPERTGKPGVGTWGSQSL